MNIPSSTERLLRASEVARRLDCAKSTIYYLAKTGQIPAVSIGKTGVRFDFDQVLAALQRGAVTRP